MRFVALAVAAALSATSTAADPGRTLESPKASGALGSVRGDCPPTVAQQVAMQVRQQDRPRLFHRLDELPPATAYAAVMRRVDGCEVPLTMVEYGRSGGR
jgi:hypothetical protein